MSMFSRLCSALLLAFLLLPLGAAGQARADEPRFTRIEPVIHDGKLQIDAEVDFQLKDQLRDAAERGLPLYFTADPVISRSPWWWVDDPVVDTTLTWRVVYNALPPPQRDAARQTTPPGVATES